MTKFLVGVLMAFMSVVAAAQVAVTEYKGQVCSADKPKHLQLNIYDARALDVPGVRVMVEAAKVDPDTTKPNRVSRAFWKLFLDAEKDGRIGRATKAHDVTIYTEQKNVKTFFWKGLVTGGDVKISAPVGVFDNVVVEFHSPLSSPVKGRIVVGAAEFGPVGCGYRLHVSAIE
jgi:hypothetical protein